MTSETNGAAAPKDHNKVELTDDEKRALFFQWKRDYEKALAAKKAADAALKNICKQAKAELGKNAVTDIKTAIALEEPAGEAALQQDIDSMLRVARWVGSPLGTQFEFFPDREPAMDRAYEAGKIAGFKGLDLRPPYDPSVPQYQRYVDGYYAAQEVLLSGFREKLQQSVPEDEPEDVPEDVPAEFVPQDTSDRPFAA